MSQNVHVSSKFLPLRSRNRFLPIQNMCNKNDPVIEDKISENDICMVDKNYGNDIIMSDSTHNSQVENMDTEQCSFAD